MRKHNLRSSFVLFLILAVFVTGSIAQKKKPAKSSPKTTIFAVLSDGRALEPIAHINKGKLEATVNGSDDSKKVAAFDNTYYKPKTTYTLIFGGANAGTVAVKSADPNADCSRNMAEITTNSTKGSIKGLVMALATNAAVRSKAASYRRRPTEAEKDEIEVLVRKEYTKQKLTPDTLHYHNLTAIDVDNDGKAEIVGSYWVDIDKLTRGLLFFIAEKDAKGKYFMGYDEYRKVDQADVMSGDITSVDEGVYHELLLDSFDYDGDGTAEIFTYTQSFEGSGFNVYKRKGDKWSSTYENSNYHCGY